MCVLFDLALESNKMLMRFVRLSYPYCQSNFQNENNDSNIDGNRNDSGDNGDNKNDGGKIISLIHGNDYIFRLLLCMVRPIFCPYCGLQVVFLNSLSVV